MKVPMPTWMTMEVLKLDTTLEVQELEIAVQHGERAHRLCLIWSNPYQCRCHRWYRRACLALGDVVQGGLTNGQLWEEVLRQ